MITTDKIYSSVYSSMDKLMVHSTTYKGGPLAMAAGLASLAVIEDEGLVENAARRGDELMRGFEGLQAKYDLIADVRGRGLIIGIEFVADKAKRTPFALGSNVHRLIASRAIEDGLMVRALPFIEVVAFSPPLCITTADCDEAVERFARSLEAATPALRRGRVSGGAPARLPSCGRACPLVPQFLHP